MLVLILTIVYYIAAKWAFEETFWKDSIMIGSYSAIAIKKLVLPLAFGWIVIPIALIKVLISHIFS